jgi:ankyrin repeat protein
MVAWGDSALGTRSAGKAWGAIVACFAFSILGPNSRGQAAEEPIALELLKPATADSAASYGEIAVDTATEASMRELLGEPISAKDRSCIWIGTEGCRTLGLKMVRANYTEDGVLSHVTLDVQKPFARSEAVESLGLGEPVEVRQSKNVTIELFLPANLALGVHGDRVIRLYLFGGHTPGMEVREPALSPEEQEEVLELLKRKAAAATQDEKDDALREAALVGNTRGVTRFLAAGASPMTTDAQGETALHHAAYHGRDAIIASLVFGASQPMNEDSVDGEQEASSFNALLDKQDNGGATALHLACLGRRIDAAKTLLRMGADPNVSDSDGKRPLHIAVLAGNVDLVEALLLARADIYLRTIRGCSALDLATDKEIRLLLVQTASRVGDDPARAKVRQVVESYLKATCEGDIDKMKSCVLPAVRKSMPDRIEKDKIQWSVKAIGFEPGTAHVRCEVTPPAGLSESLPTLFYLRYAAGNWRIADVAIEPSPAVSKEPGES